jgi:hypothetical protein
MLIAPVIHGGHGIREGAKQVENNGDANNERKGFYEEFSHIVKTGNK